MSDKPENAIPLWAGAARVISAENGYVTVTVPKLNLIAKTRSRTPEPPYKWENKAALRRIEDMFDSDARLRLAFAAYHALTWMASDKQSELFECKIRDIAKYMHYSYDQAIEGIQLAERAGVIRVERRKIDGSNENAPSIYELLEIPDNSNPAFEVIGNSGKVVGKCKIAGNPEILKEQRKNKETKVKEDSSNGSRNRPSRPLSARIALVDEYHIAALKKIYQARDVDKAVAGCKAWLLTPRGKGKAFTTRRLQTFLRDAEPLSDQKPKRGGHAGTWPDSNKAPEPKEQPISVEEQAEIAKQLAEAMARMKQGVLDGAKAAEP